MVRVRFRPNARRGDYRSGRRRRRAGGGQPASAGPASPGPASGAQPGAGDCIAHHPNSNSGYVIWYAQGCTGHDEPELDPVSSLTGSAQDLTWTAVLPSDGAVPVSSAGPTFWWGGTVTNPGPHALFGQAFAEVQFYPGAIVSNCDSAGGFNVTYAQDKFSVCTPVWQVGASNFAETAAFNAELCDGPSSRPLVMDAGDTIRIHFFIASTAGSWHVQITDLTTGHSGTVVLNSKYGPLLPAFSQQKIGNALGWGLVDDRPDSFVWEIGHTSPFTSPAARYCLPGQSICDSYDAAHWLRRQRHRHGLHLRRGLPGHPNDYGLASQFATTPQCGGPFGPDSTYCDTVLSPVP